MTQTHSHTHASYNNMYFVYSYIYYPFVRRIEATAEEKAPKDR